MGRDVGILVGVGVGKDVGAHEVYTNGSVSQHGVPNELPVKISQLV